MRDFPCYKLKKNHMSGIPQKSLFLDVETYQKQEGKDIHHFLRLAWTCRLNYYHDKHEFHEDWCYWTKSSELWKYVESLVYAKKALWVFGHNVYFDMQSSGFFKFMTRAKWLKRFSYDKGLTYILAITKDKKRINCVSTTNYFPTSLAKLGKVLGIEKGEVDFDNTSESELSKYCKIDVRIIVEAMKSFWRFIYENDMGKFRYSKAAQAMGAFRHRFMQDNIYIHREVDVSEFERKAYHGGRTECFQIGNIDGGPFVSLDINSMYPFVMKNFAYPTKLIDELENPDLSLLPNILDNYNVVCEAIVNTPVPAYAIKHNNRTVFPIGEFMVNLCSTGTRYALEAGHLKDIRLMYVYEKAHIFTSYINHFYAIKEELSRKGETFWIVIVKHFLNNLYGKWAQKRPINELRDEIDFEGYSREEIFDCETGATETITKCMNTIEINFGEETAPSSFVAIAAHITENSRFYLWGIMERLGLENLYYCDTDSVIIKENSVHKLNDILDNYELGKLEVQYKTNKLIIHACKHYETDTAIKLKGIPKRATLNEKGEYVYTYFPGQSTHLRKGYQDYYVSTEMRKRLKKEYTKGIVHPSGRVTPFVFSNGKILH